MSIERKVEILIEKNSDGELGNFGKIHGLKRKRESERERARERERERANKD